MVLLHESKKFCHLHILLLDFNCVIFRRDGIWNQFGEFRRDFSWKQRVEIWCAITKTKINVLCSDLQVQGESDQSTDDEERKRSLITSFMKSIVESPNKDESMVEICPKDVDKETFPRSQSAPIDSGKIGAVGNVDLIQVRHQNYGK